MLKDIKDDVSHKMNKVEIGGDRILKIMDQMKFDKSISSMGTYCRRLDSLNL